LHQTAYEAGRKFFEQFGKDGDVIVEIGSRDVNGSLRDHCPPNGYWVGVDSEEGPGVDLLTTSTLNTGTADLAVSSSCFEHDPCFWETFLEMARITKVGGHIYINAPSNGPVHRYPVDCWRFYPDAGQALATWATRMSFPVELIGCAVNEPYGDVWADFCAVFKRVALF